MNPDQRTAALRITENEKVSCFMYDNFTSAAELAYLCRRHLWDRQQNPGMRFADYYARHSPMDQDTFLSYQKDLQAGGQVVAKVDINLDAKHFGFIREDGTQAIYRLKDACNVSIQTFRRDQRKPALWQEAFETRLVGRELDLDGFTLLPEQSIGEQHSDQGMQMGL